MSRVRLSRCGPSSLVDSGCLLHRARGELTRAAHARSRAAPDAKAQRGGAAVRASS